VGLFRWGGQRRLRGGNGRRRRGRSRGGWTGGCGRRSRRAGWSSCWLNVEQGIDGLEIRAERLGDLTGALALASEEMNSARERKPDGIGRWLGGWGGWGRGRWRSRLRLDIRERRACRCGCGIELNRHGNLPSCYLQLIGPPAKNMRNEAIIGGWAAAEALSIGEARQHWRRSAAEWGPMLIESIESTPKSRRGNAGNTRAGRRAHLSR
jgi:hypothetical protein